MYKFRTMRPACEGDLKITVSGDKRVTAVGKFLRKTKLDELPQIVNVIKGDMSLVGPRAEVEDYVDLSNPRWKKILSIKPGITSPIAIELRNEEELLKKVHAPERYYKDVLLPYKLKKYSQYIENKSFLLDLWIIFQTFFSIFSPHDNEAELLKKISESETSNPSI